MITLDHTVKIEVDFETQSDAEDFRNAIREFMLSKYSFDSGLEIEDHMVISITKRD